MIVIQEEAYKDVVRMKHMTKDALNYSLENLMDNNNNHDNMANIYDVIQYVYTQAKVIDLAIYLRSKPSRCEIC